MAGLRWAIPGLLARSSRPGYNSEAVPAAAVEAWVADVKAAGVRSIICLLDDGQLGFYRALPEGLLEYYRRHDFEVEHIGITDPADDWERGEGELEESLGRIFGSFSRLPKPVLIHCSAGIDRTGRAVDYILDRLQADRGIGSA